MLPTTFPGINMVRVDVQTYSDPSTLAAAVNTLTAQGIVVEFSDYTNSTGQNAGGDAGVVYTGSELATESAWYASMASYFKNNPYVWLGTDNEPATAGGSLSDWQLAPTTRSATQEITIPSCWNRREAGHPVMAELRCKRL
jgi:hypothetical protein